MPRRTVVPVRSIRSEPDANLPTNDTWIVDDACQIVEVDRIDVPHDVGTVAAKGGDVVLAVVPGVTDTDSPLRERRSIEFLCLIQEVVETAAIGPVGIEIQLATDRQRIVVTQGAVEHPACRFRQRVTIDEGVVDRAKGALQLETRVEDVLLRDAAASRHRET